MKKLIISLVLCSAMILSGCGPTFVPKATRDQINPNLSLTQVVKDPDAYDGQIVLWGGIIVKTINKKKGSLIEIVQLPLDDSGRPKDVDQTQGRFIVAIQEFMDPAIYAQGRDISVAGEVTGVEDLPIGELKYTYALLRAKTIKLWPKRPVNVKIDNMTYPPYYPGMPPNMYWYTSPYLWW